MQLSDPVVLLQRDESLLYKPRNLLTLVHFPYWTRCYHCLWLSVVLLLFARSEAHTAEPLPHEATLNVFPELFEDRAVFPKDSQALITADRGLQLPRTDVDLSKGGIAGERPMPERQFFLHRNETAPQNSDIKDTVSPRFSEPVRLLLSKYRYPWEDRHLDAIVWLTPAKEGESPRGVVDVLLKDEEGKVLASHTLEELPPGGLFFSVGFPPVLAGKAGQLEVVWRDGNEILGTTVDTFHVDAKLEVLREGRIPLRILNQPGATLDHAPMTVGVPFPHGVLDSEDQVRLVDEDGNEHPLQTLVTATWSRFGPIKWLLCDFTIDLNGGPREMVLEYGPTVRRTKGQPMEVVPTSGFPDLSAGKLMVKNGELLLDRGRGGDWQRVLADGAFSGAFVTREGGQQFTVPKEGRYEVEETGSEKVVIRRTGWYANAGSGEQFCQFVTRVAFYRNSPVVRIFHTWIFTGDGNVDRIADMGWHFPVVESPQQGRMLGSFTGGDWLNASSLVQFNYADFLLPESAREMKGRAAGVLSFVTGQSRVTFGAKDFWQNFPSELEIGESGFTFYNWPRRNPPARFERPVGPRDAFRLRFAHEGEVLDFRLPEEYAQNPIWGEATNNGNINELHWSKGRPESANAQGIARTEEMFLFFADQEAADGNVARVMQGLNDETIRAVTDPAWVIATGVFGPVHPYDPDRFPEVERLYEKVVKSPARWVERLGFYGMWVHGDYPTWSLSLENRSVSNYRTLRKGHHDYPLKWLPYARSGDPEYLKLAENATRQMADANFCHFATAEVDAAVGSDHYRHQGWWDRSLLPWAGRTMTTNRHYAVDSDFLWQAWYLTGYQRARDVALLFGDLTQHYHVGARSGRPAQSMLSSYLDMYQATFDPWFLNAAHEIAKTHQARYGEDVFDAHPSLQIDTRGEGQRREDWRMADQKFYQFTRSDLFEPVARNGALYFSGDRSFVARATYQGEGGVGTDVADLVAQAWYHTRDPYYLGRLAAELDYLQTGVYEGEIDFLTGSIAGRGHGFAQTEIADGVPAAMAALAAEESIPCPIHNPLILSAEPVSQEDAGFFHFALPEVILKIPNRDLFQIMIQARSQGKGTLERQFRYTVDGPDGFSRQGDGIEFESKTGRPSNRVKHVGSAASILETDDFQGPPGIYRVRISGSIRLDPEITDTTRYRRSARWYLPLTVYDIPEVVRFQGDENGIRTQTSAQGYWFMVPEGTTGFWIRFENGQRLSVWNPDGERAWDRSLSRTEWETAAPGRVRITVPEGQAGKLWRATGGSFTIDPQIPPYFSVSRMKWFNPEEVDGSAK